MYKYRATSNENHKKTEKVILIKTVPRIYTSRPSCIICKIDKEYLSTRSWYLPMNLFLEKGQDVL